MNKKSLKVVVASYTPPKKKLRGKMNIKKSFINETQGTFGNW